MKVKNRLLNFGGNIIYQDDDYFAFSLDSVLLANFVTIKLTDKKIIDFCSGNAPIPMLLSFRTKAKIVGVELQKYIYELGLASICENEMDRQIEFINFDVNKLKEIYQDESFDIVTCNPPYFKYAKGSLINDNEGKAIARHEISINLEEIIYMASFLLKNNGTLALIHKADRLTEIIDLMHKYGIEPKKMRVVYSKRDRDANIILIEGVKNGKRGLKILSPLIVHNNNGEYTDEIRDLFGGEDNVAE